MLVPEPSQARGPLLHGVPLAADDGARLRAGARRGSGDRHGPGALAGLDSASCGQILTILPKFPGEVIGGIGRQSCIGGSRQYI